MAGKLSLVIALWLAVLASLIALLWEGRHALTPPIHENARPAADRDDAPLANQEDEAVINVPAEDDGRLHPSVAALIGQTAHDDRDHQSPFFLRLAALAGEQGLTLRDFDPTGFADEGYAFRRGDYVVAVLRGWDHCIPGDDTQRLLLFGRNGLLLDTFSCAVSDRLTRWVVGHEAVFRTDAPSPPKNDGAELIVRYIPYGDEFWGNWSHQIIYGGQRRFFAWGWHGPKGPPAPDWRGQGLCRLAIREDHFALLFPQLE